MRPIDRYRQEVRAAARAKKQGEARIGGFEPGPNDPVLLDLKATYRMPDGTTATFDGVWPSVAHLSGEVLMRAVEERAIAQAHTIAQGRKP